MFPEIDIPAVVPETEVETNIGKSFLFDFEKGDFVTADGKLIETTGLDALKVWIEKTLRTEKQKFAAYQNVQYGVNVLDLATGDYSYDFVKSEVEREIRDALEINGSITGLHSFAFSRGKRMLFCTFTVNTKFGEIGGEMSI